MKTKNRYIFFLLISFALIVVSECKNKSKKDVQIFEKEMNSLKENIGEKFQVENIIDTSGKLIKLNFSESEITIIDFWFSDCPPCLKEMKQFEKILLGKEKKVTVISISINRFSLWKTILVEHNARFSFLSNSVPNWKHYNLQSMVDEKLKNDIPIDSQEEVKNKFNVTFFPAYFVVDKDGIIKSRPVSAVDYITQL